MAVGTDSPGIGSSKGNSYLTQASEGSNNLTAVWVGGARTYRELVGTMEVLGGF